MTSKITPVNTQNFDELTPRSAPLSVVELHISQPRIRSVYHYNVLEKALQALTIISIIATIIVISTIYMVKNGVDKGWDDYIEQTKGPMMFWVNMFVLFGSLMINFASDRKDKYLINYVVDHIKNDPQLMMMDSQPIYKKIPAAINDIMARESLELSHVMASSRKKSIIDVNNT